MKLRSTLSITLTSVTFVAFTIGCASREPVKSVVIEQVKAPEQELSDHTERMSENEMLPCHQEELYQAAESGDPAKIDSLIHVGVDVEDSAPICQNPEGNFICRPTPLHLAVQSGNTDAVRVLLEAGADADANYHAVINALKAISSREDVSGQASTKLYLFGLCVERIGTPLMEAARVGSTEAVRLLLYHGADANVRPGGTFTPLRWAIHWSRASVIEQLLKAGADRCSQDSNGWTDMQYAQFLAKERITNAINSFCSDHICACSAMSDG